MNIEQLRDYCIAKKAVEETFPFDEDTLVFKVMGKMFALTSLSKANSVNLKCEAAYAIDLRERFNDVIPGYHMSKKYWNTVSFDGDVDDKLLFELVDHSYAEVVKGLPKKLQVELQNQ